MKDLSIILEELSAAFERVGLKMPEDHVESCTANSHRDRKLYSKSLTIIWGHFGKEVVESDSAGQSSGWDACDVISSCLKYHSVSTQSSTTSIYYQ